jgi:hypothetical protein
MINHDLNDDNAKTTIMFGKLCGCHYCTLQYYFRISNHNDVTNVLKDVLVVNNNVNIKYYFDSVMLMGITDFICGGIFSHALRRISDNLIRQT